MKITAKSGCFNYFQKKRCKVTLFLWMGYKLRKKSRIYYKVKKPTARSAVFKSSN